MTQYATQAHTTKPTTKPRNTAVGRSVNVYNASNYDEFEKEADAKWLASERAKHHHRARRAMFR